MPARAGRKNVVTRPDRSRPRSRQDGFSLLEAIVAMVLIAGAGMALFAWINGNIAALTALNDANRRSDATVNVVEFMERVNPVLSPDGEAALGGYSIRWHSQPVSAAVDGVGYPNGKSLYRFTLYRVEVAVRSEDGKAWFDLQLTRTGYQRVRDPSL